jgi:hypothetical protein
MDQKTEPEREPQVGQELNILEKSIIKMMEIVNDTEDRYSDVLRQDPSKEPEGEASTEENLAPLAARLRELRYRVEAGNSKLQMMLNRTEL